MTGSGLSEEGFGDTFEEDVDPALRQDQDSLVLELDGFEGPIDLLLTLARDQKVDITKISILALAEQYLEFIARAQELRLEIAADYLVMAAWLAFLKSKLLLPAPEEEGEEDDPADLAARLAFQLQRLEAMQNAAKALFDRPRLGQDFFPRGMPERIRIDRKARYEDTLVDLLKAYGRIRSREHDHDDLRILPTRLYSMEMAMKRLRFLIGDAMEWQSLTHFLPSPEPGYGTELPSADDPVLRRSALAATFAASLELTREGLMEIRQTGTFQPIYVRRAENANPAQMREDDEQEQD